MAEIKKLAPEVAALIAAGEVVERPASVIKEVVENAIDALATHITVELRRGGITYMRVTDNGRGMAEEDVPTAFLRHATSKIESGEDLESIATLGFRGEALYSIAAVGEVEIITKRREDEMGTRAVVRGGGEPVVEPCGCPDGTSVIVRDLFFNTPARMKFLKKDSVEAGYAEEIVRKIALARPDISFRFIANGKDLFFTPGDGELLNTVAALFGREYAEAMLPVSYTQDGLQISGLIGKSELTRPNRTFQIFFVNGRSVMHKSFYVALSEAYRGQVMTGRFPVAVLHINMDPALCDVNVHPSKAEIKFANDKPVFDVIYWGAKNALYAIRDTRTLHVEAKPQKEVPAPRAEQTEVLPPAAPVITRTSSYKEPVAAPPEKKEPPKSVTFTAPPVPAPKEDKPHFEARTEPEISVEVPLPREQAPKVEVEQVPEPVLEKEPFVRILGQAFDTYIVAEADGKLLLVDQHAAHERILYNALLEGLAGKGIDSQMLLMPINVRLSPNEVGS